LYKVFFWILAFALAVSLLFNGYLCYLQFSVENNLDEDWVKTFSFWWSPEEQNITSGNGILWINFTFKPVGENLSITVEINDDESTGCYAPEDKLILVFDKNRNGKIDFWDYRWENDTVYALGADNSSYTYYIVGPKGEVDFASHPIYKPEPSPWHTCIFSNETGYVFNISLPLEETGPTGIVYAIYADLPVYDENYEPRFTPIESLRVYIHFSYLP